MASGAKDLAQWFPRDSAQEATSRKTGAMTIFGHPGIDWTVVLRRRPAHIVAGHVEGGYTDMFEIICCDCGDDPGLNPSEVSPELQRIRGPYQLVAGVAAYEQHLVQHSESSGMGSRGSRRWRDRPMADPSDWS